MFSISFHKSTNYATIFLHRFKRYSVYIFIGLQALNILFHKFAKGDFYKSAGFNMITTITLPQIREEMPLRFWFSILYVRREMTLYLQSRRDCHKFTKVATVHSSAPQNWVFNLFTKKNTMGMTSQQSQSQTDLHNSTNLLSCGVGRVDHWSGN